MKNKGKFQAWLRDDEIPYSKAKLKYLIEENKKLKTTVKKMSEDTGEREMVEVKPKDMWKLKQLLGIKQSKCSYCGEKINKGDEFSIFSKPTRLICNSPFCMCEALEDDEGGKGIKPKEK